MSALLSSQRIRLAEEITFSMLSRDCASDLMMVFAFIINIAAGIPLSDTSAVKKTSCASSVKKKS